MKNKKVLLLLAQGFEAYEAAVFTDIFGFASSGGFPVELTSAGSYQILGCFMGNHFNFKS